jgi:HEAT repeat protein
VVGGIKMGFSDDRPRPGALRDSLDIDGLIQALEYKEDALVREQAAQALSEIRFLVKGTERAIEPLINIALKDDDKDVRMSAAKSLGKIGGKKVLKTFEELVEEEEDSIRKKNINEVIDKIKEWV